MTKTLFKDSIRTIRKSIVIYIAIVFFTMLCVALYTGLEWSTESIPKSIHKEMENANLYDIRMLYNRGLSEDDIQKISEIDGVDEVTGSRQGYGTFILNDNQYIQARILEINNSKNIPQNVEGNLPNEKGEVAVSKKWADDNGVSIGDTLEFVSDNTGIDTLAQKELTVTAFMDTVEYNELNVPGYGISEQNNLAVGCILYVSKESYNPLIYRGSNLVLINSDKLRGISTFSDEYKTEKENIKDDITEALKGTQLSGFTMSDRTYLPTSVVPTNLTLSLRNVKSILVSVFLLIGLLICYSSIIRMVNDQSYLIGTKIAMGIKPRAIRLQYYFYTESAIAIGCVLGGFLGRLIAEILLSVCSENYAIPFACKLDYHPLVLICVFEIILVFFVTLFGVHFTLKRKIVDLLNNNTVISAKKHFYERFRVWRKLSLFTRAVINNFFNEKKRVFETLIGIIGSTALLTISLTMYYDVNQSFNIQYQDYFNFDSYIYYDGSTKTSEEIASVLDERDIPYTKVMHTRKYMSKPDDLVGNTHIIVFDDKESFKNLVNIVPDNEDNDSDVHKGLWVSAAYRNYFGDEESDVIRFIDKDGYTKVPTEGFFKYHLIYYQLFMDRDTYKTHMGEPAVNNAFMIRSEGKDREELLDALFEIPGYRMFTDYYKQSYNSYGSFKGIANMLVIIYFILAIILSLMVSLTVLNMFLNEKKRELITMMINGYSSTKVKLYIFLDTLFITLVGIIIGLIFGGFMGLKSVVAFESDAVCFLHKIPISAIVISVAAIIMIMFALSMIAQRKIDKYKLSDINEGV
ncbi:MAG: hypothetical protein KBT27_12440 [Prevotellaceae bacterium]|nr:hypothetical protein [Candidatus Faecinaster equi]